MADESRFCTSCGIATAPASAPPHPSGIVSPTGAPLSAVTDFIQEVASVSLRDIAGVDRERAVDKARGLTAASELTRTLGLARDPARRRTAHRLAAAGSAWAGRFARPRALRLRGT